MEASSDDDLTLDDDNARFLQSSDTSPIRLVGRKDGLPEVALPF
jgi:hypothetical protein